MLNVVSGYELEVNVVESEDCEMEATQIPGIDLPARFVSSNLCKSVSTTFLVVIALVRIAKFVL